jgi:hypothetical protein
MTIGSITGSSRSAGSRIAPVGPPAVWIVAAVVLACGIYPLLPAAAASTPPLRPATSVRIRTGTLAVADTNETTSQVRPGEAAPARSMPPDPAPLASWRRRLCGIIVAPQLHEALFEQDGKTQVLREGEQLDGWILASIGGGQVTLQSAETKQIITLDAPLGDDPRRSQIPHTPDSTEVGLHAKATQAVEVASASQATEQALAETQLTRATRRMMQH